MPFEQCLREQAILHPSLMPQDAVKLCYQAAYGAEHLAPDPAHAVRVFEQEFERTAPKDGPLAEVIGPDFARVNLSVWKHRGLPPRILLDAFLKTAACPAGADADQQFDSMLSCVARLAQDGALPFDVAAFGSFLAHYRANGGGALHHSAQYRDREKPAYRVVRRELLTGTDSAI